MGPERQKGRRSELEKSLRQVEAQKRTARQNAVLSGITRIFHEALTCRTEEELGRVCLAVAEEITQSKFGFIGEINRDTGKLNDIVISDPGRELCRLQDKSGHGKRVPMDFAIHGIYGRVLEDEEGFFTNDPLSHPDSIGVPDGHPPLTSFLGFPLAHAGRTIGMVGLGNREGGYGSEELAAVEALAPAIVQAFVSKRAEEALRGNEERLKKSQEIAHLGTWELDIVNNILTWSDEVYRIFGLRPQEFGATYESFLEIVHPDDRKAVDDAYSSSVSGGRDSYEIEHRVVRKSTGEIRHVHEKCEHIRAASGKVIRSVGMVHDVTERRQAEEALRQAKYDLEITVKERTAELQQINARLREENEERVQTELILRLEESRLDALLHLSRIGEAPLKEITEFTLEQAIALSHSKIGFLGFVNEDESLYTLHAVSKSVVKECNVTGDPLQWHVIDAGIWADAIREHKTLFVNDYSKPHPKKKGLPLGHLHVERFMVVPIIESDRVVVVAGVGNKASEYDKSDERQIVLLLSGMWGCLQKERSRQDLQKAYNELEERTRELAAKNVELKKSQYLLEKTFASLDEVVLLVDLADPSARRIVAANPAAKRVFGYSEEELIGSSTEMLHVNKAMFERFGSELAATLDAKGVYQCEFQMRRKDGSIILTEQTVSEVLDESGKRTGAVSSLRDISERKEAEKRLLAYQDQLRSLSLELSLIEERERRKLAEGLHDSVAQLLVLSKFNLEDVLAKSSLGAGRIEIEQVCQYLDETVEQTRSLMFELSPPDLHALGLTAGLGGLAERIGCTHNLQVDFSADEIPEGALNEDANILLYRSVQELLMNIVKHAGVSRAKLSLLIRGDAIRVEVKDEGSGCDLSNTVSYGKMERKGGFGLLSIKERLFHLGGQFEISSKPGKGTRVTLTVPLPEEKVVSTAEPVAPLRVVIADDHQMMREGLRSLLESQNFEIVGEAQDGEEAVRITRETNPDVVIMDILMPVMDGIEATRRILAELPEIKIIGLSMNRDKFRISQALESGARGFVLKGSAFQELNQAIHAVVNDKSIFLSDAIRDFFPDGGEHHFSNEG